ncbi:MAG TPA: hypothetical protein VKB96_14630 [Gammaproteobacteria bacterium]|nr:hypothetical protein [Gammaproteobacteria bacterium]
MTAICGQLKISPARGVSNVAGDISLATGGKWMQLHINLVYDKLDFVQIFGSVGLSGNGPIFSDTLINVSRLQMLDAQIRYQAKRIYMPGPTFVISPLAYAKARASGTQATEI